MNARRVMLGAALALILLFAALTATVLVRQGPDPLTAISLLVLAMLGFGVVGALKDEPPQ